MNAPTIVDALVHEIRPLRAELRLRRAALREIACGNRAAAKAKDIAREARTEKARP